MPRSTGVCPHCQARRPLAPPGEVGKTPCPNCGLTADELPPALPAARGSRKASGKKSSVSKLAAVVVSVAVLVPAGWMIVRSLRELEILPKPPAATIAPDPATVAAGPLPEDPSERCELRVFRETPGGEAVIALTEPGKMTEFRPGLFAHRGRLAREIVRQGVLLAVREGLNTPVRDASIGDPLPSGKPADVIEVVTHLPRLEWAPALVLCRGEGPKRVALVKRTLSKSGSSVDYAALAETSELLARTELPEALSKAGIARRPAPAAGDGALPEGVEDQLNRMSFPQQFSALQALHAAVRSGGTSPRRLGALARGYANLALLTEFQWDAAYKAYQARALIYAQKLVAADPKSPVGLWHRAYAFAMAGMHWQVLEDLQEASRLASALPERDRPSPPGWVALIDALCHYADDKLKDPAGPNAELAALLHLLALEQPAQTEVALRAARAAIEANPECFRAHDALCEVGGVANLHVATEFAPEVLTEAIPRRIAAMPGVPEAVRKMAEGKPYEVAMTRALDEASDSAEPSWGALARIVRETRFVLTWRRLLFMSRQWNVPADEYWQGVRPLVAAHRFSPFLEAYVVGPNNHPEFPAFINDLDTTDLGLNHTQMGRMFNSEMNPPRMDAFHSISMFLSDWCVRDLATVLFIDRPRVAPDFARKLLSVSPNSPYAMGLLVEDAWDESQANLKAWQEVVGNHPTFLASLARAFRKQGRADDAEAVLKRYIERSADRWAFQELADCYKQRGDEARWKATLDGFLEKVEDHGLDHAKVRVDIAEALMKGGRYDQARPYAEAAAQSWAAWAMQTAQKCAEGQQDWKAAENWARNQSERYPDSSAYLWVEFCYRTGRGDTDAARDWTLSFLDGLAARGQEGQALLVRGYLEILNGKPAEAIGPLQQLIDRKGENIANHKMGVLTLASAAAQVSDNKLLGPALDQAISEYAENAPKFCGVMAKVREAVAKGAPDAFDRQAVDKLINDTPEVAKGTPAFIVASYLAGLKRHDEAKPYWRLAAGNGGGSFWWKLIATSTLRERYHDAVTSKQ